jgi:hypothetical protein
MGSGARRTFLSAAVALLLLSLLAAASPSRADLQQLDVDMGWGERARQGTWTPIGITVADGKPRNAVVELYAPHDSSQAMKIHQHIAIGPMPQTYVLYAPLVINYSEPVKLEIRDAQSRKLLAEQNIYDRSAEDFDSRHRRLMDDNQNTILIGVSGRAPAMGQLESGSNGPRLGFLKQAYLPRTPKGYDSLNLLVLNEPNFTAMEAEQQKAIRDWVRAGGHLVLWPSEDPVPPDDPLVRLLPCRIGEVTVAEVPKDELQRFGLTERFAKLKARRLTPEPGAATYTVLGEKGPQVVRAARGLGYVTVVSFDASGLQFADFNRAQTFWGSVCDPKSTSRNYTGNLRIYTHKVGNQIQDDKRAEAAGQIIDLLGDVPGVGTFGFKYVAMVLLAMMVIVGPVDWFVLKKIGRQPWTWATTAGWIGLITVSAIFVGSVFRSGDLHFRTLQLIDQVDGSVVARTDVVGLYSPKTDDYKMEVRPASWWEPISTDQFGYGRNVMVGIPFRQDGVENAPEEATINVWNLRFLTGERLGQGDPVIGAALTWGEETVSITNRAATKRPRITGTITNLSDFPLRRVWLRTARRSVDLSSLSGFPAEGLAPKATLPVDLEVDANARGDFWAVDANTQGQQQPQMRYGRWVLLQPREATEVVRAAGNLAPERGRRIDALVDTDGKESPKYAVIYAESEAASGAAKLVDQQPLEKHWQVVRAVVPLNSENQSKP